MEVTEHWLYDDAVHGEPPTDPGQHALHWTLVVARNGDDLSGALEQVLSHIGVAPESALHLLGGTRPGVRRPTLRHRDGTTALSLRLLDYDDTSDAVESGEEWLIVREGEAVSVVRPPAQGASTVAPSPVPTHFATAQGPVEQLVHGVLEAALQGYEAVVAELEVDVDEVEASVFSPRRTADAERIYALKRELAESRRAVLPLIDLLQRQVRQDVVLGGWQHHLGVADLSERLHRVAEQVEILDGLLSSILDAYVARVSVQQNEDMRKISAGAALVVVPTFLAGVWGMNFDGMPELHWALGYPMALTTMLLSVLGIWWAFRRVGWF